MHREIFSSKIRIDAQKIEDCCSRKFAIKNGSNPVFEPNILAGVEGLEPSRTVLETGMLPLHHTPKERHIKFLLCSICNIGTRLWRPLLYQLSYTPMSLSDFNSLPHFALICKLFLQKKLFIFITADLRKIYPYDILRDIIWIYSLHNHNVFTNDRFRLSFSGNRHNKVIIGFCRYSVAYAVYYYVI